MANRLESRRDVTWLCDKCA